MPAKAATSKKRSSSPTKKQATAKGQYSTLPFILRFYIYALHGLSFEVIFTAIWEVTRQNYKAIGFSSVWAFFIYSIALVGIEQFYIAGLKKIWLPARALIYTAWIYAVEYAAGFLLEIFNAKPWDYKLFPFNLHGHITLEYLPFWIIMSIACEYFLIKPLLHIGIPASGAAKDEMPKRSHVLVLIAVFVGALAYTYVYLVAQYNNGEYYKPVSELYKSIGNMEAAKPAAQPHEPPGSSGSSSSKPSH